MARAPGRHTGAKSPPAPCCRLTFAISTAAPAMDSFRPLFVVGHPRSGTTLLATILSRHSAIAGTPETHFLNEVQHACAPYLRHGAPAAVDRLLETPLRSAAVQRDDLLARLAGYPRVTMPLLFRCWLEAFAASHGKPFVLEKTPYHIRHILEILSWYPMARIIWILRDGRACVASMKKVDWAGDDVTALSRRWVRNVAYALRAERRYPDRIVRVRYEDLLAEPELTLTQLHRALGLPFEPAELDHRRRVETVESWELEWKKNVFRPMLLDRRFAWRHELSMRERRRATALMWDKLEQLGYEPGERLDVGDRLVRELYRTHDRIVFSDLGLWGMMAGYRQRKKWRAAVRAARWSTS
jgi:hypothetical protein